MTRRKMRVLHVGKYYPPEKGGIETHVAGLCEALAEHTSVSVLVANRGQRTVREQVNGIPVTRAGTLLNLAGAPLCPSMIGLIRSARPDLVHLHAPNPGGVLAILGSHYRGPLVVSYHSDVIRQRLLNSLFQPVMNHLLRRSVGIAATSEAYVSASPVLRRFEERCRIIPYAIDAHSMSAVEPAAVRRIQDRYPGPLLLSVGRLVSYKGFEYLIRAMRQVNATLLLVGNGPLSGSLKRLASECGAASRVRFLNSVEDARPYYHAADLFVLPSVTEAEAFGIVQLEAMAAAKPVINTALRSSVPYVSIHQQSGLTVPCRDSEALAAAINLLLENADLRLRFGQAGRLRTEREFTVEQMVHRTLRLYEEAWQEQGCRAAEAAAGSGSYLSTES